MRYFTAIWVIFHKTCKPKRLFVIKQAAFKRRYSMKNSFYHLMTLMAFAVKGHQWRFSRPVLACRQNVIDSYNQSMQLDSVAANK